MLCDSCKRCVGRIYQGTVVRFCLLRNEIFSTNECTYFDEIPPFKEDLEPNSFDLSED